MPEHTIPDSLVDAIKQGRAVLVVGAGIGVPSWKQVLERMTKELEAKNHGGDDATTKDLAKLLHKGSLVRAIGYLARALGEEACDRIVQELWATPAELPPIVKAIAELPFRHVWTTFPGDMLEQAMELHRPEGWPETRVCTYQDLGGLSRRRRTLVKMLGNFDTYVVTPNSVRRALARAVDLRDYARELYVEGTLVFVGFRYGDPDLSALLDRVFGMFEPPRSNHYLLGAGVGPVTVDELMAEHHIEVVNLAGKGGDDQAEKSVVDWLDALRIATAAANVSLVQNRPDADDLEGWMTLFGEGDGEARDAIDAIEKAARDGGDGERVIEVLLAKLDHESEPAGKVALLRDAAGVYEQMLHDTAHAFETACAALHIDPSDDATVALAERLATATGGWSQLVNEASEITTEVTEPVLAARWWIRLGGWYATKLDRLDYALPSYRRAIELDRKNPAGHDGLSDVLRRQQKWAELADALRGHIEVEPDPSHKIDLYLQLGDLLESQLSQTAKAVDAYEGAVEVGEGHGLDDALAALERLYRRDERWAKLAKVLERRSDVLEEAGEAGRATAIRHELATLRAEKLGDLEGAIAKHEAALEKDGADRDALKALVDLYDKTGRSDDYLRTLERLAKVAPDNERLSTLRKVAAELEDKDGASERAEAAYRGILETDPGADDAYRGLARVLRARGAWYDLVALLERHVAAAKNPVQRVELCLDAAAIHEKELDDPHKAIEALLNALSIDENNRAALASLGRLYRRTEQWDKAVATLVRHAKLEGNRGAHLWAEAGDLALTKDDDADAAARYLDQALAIDPDHLAALRTQGALHEQKGAWASAIDDLLRAEALAGQRGERIELLVRAAELAEQRLEDPGRALGLLERVLRLDPDHVAAGQKVADRLIAAERWDDAVPVLEMLARHAEGGDRLDRARREAQLGKAYEQLHRTEKAARHYRVAVESDPDNLDAALGLAQTLLTEAQAAEGGAQAATPAAEDRWREIDRRYREVLARHRTGLADGQVADIWYRLGLTARALGDDKKAENALRRALERDPGHDATLQALVDLGGQRGDWKMVIEAKRAMVDGAPEALQLKLLDEIGDLLRAKLKDPGTAVGAYLEALKLAPGNRALLHKLLDAYSEQKQWRRAVDILGELAQQDTSPARRSKYHYAAAVIARDELHDVELAVERFSAALDDAPETPKAFEAVDKLLTDHHDWKNLARQVRKQLKRMGDEAEPAKVLELWTRLGDLYTDHLGNPELAIEAYEIAAQIDPEDRARHEQLADLYIEAGEARRADAIRELQTLLGFAPDRVEIYKTLSNLYQEEHELDKAWCLAQALVFLGAASDAERALYVKYRPAQFIPATRRLTEELWQKSIIHPQEDRLVGAIFASTLGPIAATTGQGLAAFGLDPKNRTDLEHDNRLVPRVVKYASSVLGLDPAPQVWLDQGEGLRIANTIEKGKLAPSLLVGATHQGKQDERELAFEVGKRLAYLRPERFVTYAVQGLPKLESAFHAALLAAGAEAEAPSDEARRLASSMKQSVPAAVLEQVAGLAAKLGGRVTNGAMIAWRGATDLTANRAGLILANDLASAAKAIATETTTMSTAPVKDRLRDLLAYAVSEGYFQVRRHLGLTVRSEAAA
ncbi:MAG TPA: tetratricopeptide repeat protein [Kofleriaceae bacterium]|nr:tetratricopeptide repeat protein [Kofleriaceae bacterium]